MASLPIRPSRAAWLLVLLWGLSACSVPSQQAPSPPPPSRALIFSQIGLASWYGRRHQGHETADGEKYDMHAMTAAHRTLALGTIARVTNLANGKSVKVRINDRGPYWRGRVIDLSTAAATALGIREDGIERVKIEVFAADQPQS